MVTLTVLLLLCVSLISFALGIAWPGQVKMIQYIAPGGEAPVIRNVLNTAEIVGGNGGLNLTVDTNIPQYDDAVPVNSLVIAAGQYVTFDPNYDVILLCVTFGCECITYPPLSSDKIEFLGIAGIGALVTCDAHVTREDVGWSAFLNVKTCNIPLLWRLSNPPKSNTQMAKLLLQKAALINVVDCTRFNNIEKSTLTLIVDCQFITL